MPLINRKGQLIRRLMQLFNKEMQLITDQCNELTDQCHQLSDQCYELTADLVQFHVHKLLNGANLSESLFLPIGRKDGTGLDKADHLLCSVHTCVNWANVFD